MSLEPVHLDFVESYAPPFGRSKQLFPLLGLSGAQLDAIASWDLADDVAGDRAEPMRDKPKPHGDPLEEPAREAPRRGDEPQRTERERPIAPAKDLPVDERP